jgi:uncharacterized membrane protein (UPF0136 family)
MNAFAKIYFFVFAALTAAGGVMGFIKASSKASLISGVLAGVLLAFAGQSIPTKPVSGGAIALIVSALLLGRFLSAYLKKGAVMPAIPIIILGAIGSVIAILVLVRR